ncbi:MAG: substrate-binding domain-containing protein, partial [Kiritimatiellae bacterium]|nr:substrate-binding domain-containing protein [Kiritimatiellia bacterium]
ATVLRYLIRQKVRVPADISVAGYGYVQELYSYLRFATVDQHPTQFGSRAAEMLIEWLADPARQPESVVIPCTLVPGETVAQVRRG